MDHPQSLKVFLGMTLSPSSPPVEPGQNRNWKEEGKGQRQTQIRAIWCCKSKSLWRLLGLFKGGGKWLRIKTSHSSESPAVFSFLRSDSACVLCLTMKTEQNSAAGVHRLPDFWVLRHSWERSYSSDKGETSYLIPPQQPVLGSVSPSLMDSLTL